MDNRFSDHRRQLLVVGNNKSSRTEVKSGIPQGSVLGPLLFIIFINDLPSEVKSWIKIFADDTKIFRAICRVRDGEILQEDLNKLASWAIKWQLPFNEPKCKAVHYGRGNQRTNYIVSPGPARSCGSATGSAPS